MLKLAFGCDIPPQLHVSPESERLTRAGFLSPTANMKAVRVVERGSRKPLSHLWTADYVDGSSAWVKWCNANYWNVPPRRYPERGFWHLLTADPDAKVLVIETMDDYFEVCRTLGVSRNGSLPTGVLARGFDALRMLEPAVTELRSIYIDYDVPCMAWFKWAFTSAECIKEPATRATLDTEVA